MLLFLNLLDTPEEKYKFQQIYEKYRNIMFHTAYNILKDMFLAEDAVQHSFLKIAKTFHKIDDIDSHQTKAFIYVIVKNEARTIYRRRKKENTVSYEDLDNVYVSTQTIEDDCFDKMDYETLVNRILKLPKIYKEALYLEQIMGYTITEISYLLDLKYDTARKRIERAKKMLAAEITEKSLEGKI